uniref:Uncharacterized protein n=1 Tax=Arion vulgaris TaxID=1028688 RepID=A0A0B7ACX0_9EUPU
MLSSGIKLHYLYKSLLRLVGDNIRLLGLGDRLRSLRLGLSDRARGESARSGLAVRAGLRDLRGVPKDAPRRVNASPLTKVLVPCAKLGQT